MKNLHPRHQEVRPLITTKESAPAQWGFVLDDLIAVTNHWLPFGAGSIFGQEKMGLEGWRFCDQAIDFSISVCIGYADAPPLNLPEPESTPSPYRDLLNELPAASTQPPVRRNAPSSALTGAGARKCAGT